MTLLAEELSMVVASYGTVVSGFSGRFDSREVVGITGPSGAGKSTLARGLCGVQQLAGGSVYLQDDVRHDLGTFEHPGTSTVQLAFQQPISTFPPHLPLEVPLFDAARRRWRRSDGREKRSVINGRKGAVRELNQLLEELGIPGELLRRRPREVSGGQLQRIALARALAPGPRFLICDEITSAVDPVTERRSLELLGRYRRRHELGLIVISHDIGLLERNCHRVIVMDRGTAVESGDPATLFAEPKHPTTLAIAGARREITGGTL